MKKGMFSLLISISFLFGCNDDLFQYSVHTINSSSYQNRYNTLNLIQILNNPPSDPDSFKVALIADSHGYFDVLEEAVNSINGNPSISFVIHLGDFAHNGMLFQYEKTIDILLKLQKPFFVILGNHDCLSNGREIYDQIFGSSDFSFLFGNSYFVLFNNNSWETSVSDFNTFYYMATAETENAAVKHRFALCHIPFFCDDRFSTEIQDGYMDLLSKNDFDMTIHGHTHRYTLIEENDDVTTLVLDDIGDRNYYVLQISGETVSIENIYF